MVVTVPGLCSSMLSRNRDSEIGLIRKVDLVRGDLGAAKLRDIAVHFGLQFSGLIGGQAGVTGLSGEGCGPGARAPGGCCIRTLREKDEKNQGYDSASAFAHASRHTTFFLSGKWRRTRAPCWTVPTPMLPMSADVWLTSRTLGAGRE